MLECPSTITSHGHGLCPSGPSHPKQTSMPVSGKRHRSLRSPSLAIKRLIIPGDAVGKTVDSRILRALVMGWLLSVLGPSWASSLLEGKRTSPGRRESTLKGWDS